MISSAPRLAHIVDVRGARGRDHAGADMLGKLNGEAGNAARPALDQDRLAGLELQRVLDRAQAVSPVSASAAASMCDSPSGFLATMAALIAIFSA